MEDKLNKQQIPNNKPINSHTIKSIIITFIIILLCTIILVGYGTYNIISYSNIYEGVYIGDIYVGGNSIDSTIKLLNEKYQIPLNNRKILVTCDNYALKLDCKQLDCKYNIEEATNNAFLVGREGNIFKRLINISKIKKNNIVIPLEILVNKRKIYKEICNFNKKIYQPVEESKVEINDEEIIIHIGTKGKKIDEDKSVNLIENIIKSNKSQTVDLFYEDIKPKPINIEKYYNKTFIENKNAYYEIKDYKINIVPHVIGKKFDKNKAKKLINISDPYSKEFHIPFIYTQPDILKEDLEKKFFSNILGKYSTYFNKNYLTRSHNIKLAASKIDEVVLDKGDIFSFNQIVGKRTLKTGFKNAHVYMGDKVVDGVGGGVCQVSTTLYNVALLSNLDIINRTNHSMPVSYVKLGKDAAVSYGTLDLQFKNNTNWPIKIISEVNSGKITFSILGTNEYPKKTVEIISETLKIIPFDIKIINDSSLPQGEIKIQQYGCNGSIVNTYKIVKEDGQIVNKSLISKSHYSSMPQIEIHGTKKQESIQAETNMPSSDE